MRVPAKEKDPQRCGSFLFARDHVRDRLLLQRSGKSDTASRNLRIDIRRGPSPMTGNDKATQCTAFDMAAAAL
ncbi:hypothetical protein [Burkholderia dolosa]|uniref:hypothetical protein n=1 Tax=Burkholderia dolosa TaxID=152500 RepID=UPI00159139EE|nr:hypothetical protein [Burkholderia dolosa]MBR8300010.1 hypothetical protein [Burkholderia dolosa]MBY4754260.1 hypothetical protein [Burkholderia dolosa]